MGVSCAKAMLVIMVFMHLTWEANWKYVLTIPAAMMSCFLVLMLIPDVGLRGNKYSEERMVYAADKDPVHIEADGHGDSHGADGHAEHGEHGAESSAAHGEHPTTEAHGAGADH